MKRVFGLVAFCLLSLTAISQENSKNEKLYAKEPVWINMIDDTLSNYFEVEKAFDTYWKYHEKPETEHDVIGEYVEREAGRVSKRKQRKIDGENTVRMAVKKYEVWHELIIPYVKSDGRIMYPSERLKLDAEIKNAQQ
jgi:adenylate kinase family enzyme